MAATWLGLFLLPQLVILGQLRGQLIFVYHKELNCEFATWHPEQ